MRKQFMVCLVSLSLAGCAAGAGYSEDMEIAKGPDPMFSGSDKTPPEKTAACLANAMSKHPKKDELYIAVGELSDKTGKLNISGEEGTGRFLSQGTTDMVYSALKRTGVQVVALGDAEFRDLSTWIVHQGSKLRLLGDGREYYWNDTNNDGVINSRDQGVDYIRPQTGTVTPPTHLIQGAWTSLDFVPGGGVEASVGGIGGKYRQHRMIVGGDFRLTTMPRGSHRGGVIVASPSISKQLVADEFRAGIFRFFGSGASTTLVQFDAGQQRREPIQFTQKLMSQYVVNRLVKQLYGISDATCPLETDKAIERHKEELRKQS